MMHNAWSVFRNRDNPILVLLGAGMLVAFLSLLWLVEEIGMRNNGHEKWLLFKRCCMVAAVTVLLMTIRVNLAVPWWFASMVWLLCLNTIVLGAAIVLPWC
jgi:hypothetical protein